MGVAERREVSSVFCESPDPAKAELRAEIEKQTKLFEAFGGKIQQVPAGVSGQVETKGQTQLVIQTERQKAKKRIRVEDA
jgi:hypothetical protein